MAAYSTLQFAGAKGGTTSCRIEGVTSGAALNTLGTGLLTHTNASYVGYRIYTEVATPTPPTDSPFAGVFDKAVMVFKTSGNDVVKISLPAPKASIFDWNNGKRFVLGAVMTDVATKLGAATGKTLTPSSSKALIRK